MLKKLAWVALTLLLISGTCLGSCLAVVWLDQPPSDQEMIDNLAAHRAAFESLISMIHEDRGLERVDDDWTSPEDPSTIGISKERIAQYRQLFAEAGVPRGFYSYDNGHTIVFVMYTRGLSISGSSKSYGYTDLALSAPTGSGPLDAYHGQAKVNVTRGLGGGWWLAFDSN